MTTITLFFDIIQVNNVNMLLEKNIYDYGSDLQLNPFAFSLANRRSL